MYKWQAEKDCPEGVRDHAYYLSYHRDRHAGLLHNGIRPIAAIRHKSMMIKPRNFIIDFEI